MKLGQYKHYRGNKYEVIGVACHSETLEKLLVYKALYNSKDFGTDVLWVRPQSMFEESVEIDGKTVPRFVHLES